MNHVVSHHQHPNQLRHRAEMLRRLAIRLDSIRAGDLLAIAGVDTWDSPRAELCRELLRSNLAQIDEAGRQLRNGARSLEDQAAAADTAAVIIR